MLRIPNAGSQRNPLSSTPDMPPAVWNERMKAEARTAWPGDGRNVETCKGNVAPNGTVTIRISRPHKQRRTP